MGSEGQKWAGRGRSQARHYVHVARWPSSLLFRLDAFGSGLYLQIRRKQLELACVHALFVHSLVRFGYFPGLTRWAWRCRSLGGRFRFPCFSGDGISFGGCFTCVFVGLWSPGLFWWPLVPCRAVLGHVFSLLVCQQASEGLPEAILDSF